MGKQGWLDTLIQEQYLPAIAALNDSSSGREQALVLLEDMRGWAQRGATALNQQQSLMDQIRRAIKDWFGNQHFNLNVIGLSRDEYFQLNHQKQESARTRQLHQ